MMSRAIYCNFKQIYKVLNNPGNINIARLSSNCAPTVAVILSGSGVFDGTEIHEASATLVHLTREGAAPVCYAPCENQMHVIDHSKLEPADNECRNILVESARIARGCIKPITELKCNSAEALVFPGGFGAAKNLSDFACKGKDLTVHPEVERVMKEFHEAKKPIALCCISPVLAAKVFCGCTITLGKSDKGGCWPHSDAIKAVEEMGAKHEEKEVNEIAFDEKNLLITTPAFMYEGQFHQIYDGIGEMIKKLMCLLKK